MSNFKLAKKDALTDTRSSVLDLHDKKLEYFEFEKKNLSNYQHELEHLKKNNGDSHDITELEERIYRIVNDLDLNEYLLDFYLVINKESSTEENDKKGSMDTFIGSTINNSKSELYNEYIQKFNPELKQINNVKVNVSCKKCNNKNFIYDPRLADEICVSCGISTHNLDYNDPSQLLHSETINPVFVFNYKRNNHFQECLNQLQAKENTKIPPRIINDLTEEFKKYNITDPKMFTPTLVKGYLKKLKYNKYYEHIPTIINEFCGLRAPKMTPELEQQLKIMFDEIQGPFEKYSKIICPERKNFLNYNYVFYKMCQLLKKDEFLNFFPLLKNREILYQHDLIWKGICKDVHWQFIPSI
uniref:TFIIB-type domain-containing protein n=1 Tax=viral metagenome TaxID=1070528 RepID=A0A6C0IA81_9ZZZZ